MNRFHFIEKKISDDKIISMDDFWDSIKFKNLESNQQRFSPFKERLDLFYICLLIGLKTESKIPIKEFEFSVINDTWTINLKNKSKAREFILGMLLSVLVKDYKNDKPKIQKIINENLDNKNDHKLSEIGMEKIHEYCFGGYCRLLSELEYQPPETIIIFYDKIKKLLN